MHLFRKILAWIIGVPAALIIIALAVANRQTVAFSLDPFSRTEPFLGFSAPLFILLLIAVLLGILLGGAVMWLSQGKWRRLARDTRKDASHWRDEADRLRNRPQPPAAAIAADAPDYDIQEGRAP